MNWQKRARVGVAIFGIGSAIGVYAVMGERAKPAPAVKITRIDPKALIESQGNVLQQVRGTRQDYLIEAAQQLTYEGGATKLVGVKVTVRNRGGRDYIITAREARAGEHQQDLHLTGDVRLEASDGFAIATEEAFFTEGDGMVRTPGTFSFSRSQLSGTGAGMSYDEPNDVLTINGQADVRLKDDAGSTVTQFSAGSAVFDRPQHLLRLDSSVHMLHNTEVIDTQRASVYLSDDDAIVNMTELRGHAEVRGSGQGLDWMSAESIDLDYADGGETLERVVLVDDARIGLSGSEGTSARQIFGERLDMNLAADGSVLALVGRDGVRLEMARTAMTTARSIKAKSVDGNGTEGKGLREIRFRDDVEYREEARADAPPRTAHSKQLQLALASDAVESAVFSGGVTFDEGAFKAAGGEALYEPVKGTLRLTTVAGSAPPRVADERVTVDAARIDVTLASRAMVAEGNVKTTLQPQRPNSTTKLPGLLKGEQAVNVSADRFTYAGSAGKATYDGAASLLQGDTAIRATSITLDQDKGDLLAAGDARSTLPLDTGRSVGSAPKITYTDATRIVAYEGMAAQPAALPAPAVPARMAQLTGPQGELRAVRIEVLLAKAEGKADRLEAYADVSLKVDTRIATGSRLTYFADEQRYLMTGTGAAQVRVVENCRQTTGRTLIFFKSADRIIVDGNEQSRTQTTTGGTGACTQPRPR